MPIWTKTLRNVSKILFKKRREKSSEGQRSPNQHYQGVPKEVTTEYTRAILGKGKRYREGDGGKKWRKSVKKSQEPSHFTLQI